MKFGEMISTMVGAASTGLSNNSTGVPIDSKQIAQRYLCANPDTNAFVALAVDEESYDSIPGVPGAGSHWGHFHRPDVILPDGGAGGPFGPGRGWGPRGGPMHRRHHHGDHEIANDENAFQQWILVKETNIADAPPGPVNSFTGHYLQVLPDMGRMYPGRHVPITGPETLKGTPYVSFKLNVAKGGWHTLFLRWTGGDLQGRGDSLYVAMFDEKGETVTGEHTVKPSMVGIDEKPGLFAGCCMEWETHSCPCFKNRPEESVCPRFLDVEIASHRGVQCAVGPGVMDIVRDPKWYLFAGHEEGAVVNFDSEPWDASCEANGHNIADSGHDFPMWNLQGGKKYELKVFAREDGTALEAIYLAGPDAKTPPLDHRYSEGESTLCPLPRASFGIFSWTTFFLLAIVGLIGGVAYMIRRDGSVRVFLERFKFNRSSTGFLGGGGGISRGAGSYAPVTMMQSTMGENFVLDTTNNAGPIGGGNSNYVPPPSDPQL